MTKECRQSINYQVMLIFIYLITKVLVAMCTELAIDNSADV